MSDRQRNSPKSQRTRRRILEAAMRLFAERGYHASTNADIADAADLTRGAMLYHFPTRQALLEAAIVHIQARRTEMFEAAVAEIPEDTDVSEHAIDVYWELLHQTPFRAFAELEAAARTDEELAAALRPAQAAFDRAQIGGRLVNLLQAGPNPRFQASRDLARFMLEGLAQASLTYERDGRIDRLLAVIKRATHMLNRKGAVQDLWED